MNKKSSLFATAILLCSIACAPRPGHTLSQPLCATGGTTWVTERPTTDPRYPGASLWLFCDSGLNIVGDSLDPCINQGSICTQAVNDAICKLLGYDKASGPSTSAPAGPNEVVRSLSGEYCLRRGTYAAALPDNLASLPGEPCMRIDSISCVRTHQRMADSLESIIMEAVMAPASPAGTSSGPNGLAAPGSHSKLGGPASASGANASPQKPIAAGIQRRVGGRQPGEGAQQSVEL